MKLHGIAGLLLLLLLLLVGSFCAADDAAPAKPNLNGRPELTSKTRLELIRLMQAEFAFSRQIFPMGEKGISLTTDGKFSPDPQALSRLAATKGVAARPGDRLQITNVLFKDDSITLEINGGPKKKGHWYDHVTVGGMGGETPVHEEKNINAKGSYLELVFPKHVPELNSVELKALLAPALDFAAKSPAQAYLDTLPPKVKDAITHHQVMVGMNKEMVTESLGRAPQKVRERDGNQDYEEWIYGQPPADVQFIRFVGEEVSQVKVMPVGGEAVIRTAKEIEVDPKTGVCVMTNASQAELQKAQETRDAINQQKQEQHDAATASRRPAPTLKRPDEQKASQQGTQGNDPSAPAPQTGSDRPEWGTKGGEQPPPPPPPK